MVYGSRLSGGRAQRAYLFWHMVGNRFLSLLTGLLFNTTLRDMETGYKAFRTEMLKGAAADRGPVRDRAGDHGVDLPAPPADLRGADLLLRAHVRGGQEHHVARRVPRRVGAAAGAGGARAVSAPRSGLAGRCRTGGHGLLKMGLLATLVSVNVALRQVDGARLAQSGRRAASTTCRWRWRRSACWERRVSLPGVDGAPG